MTAEARKRFKENYAQLRNAQKSSRGAPIYSLLVNRPFGRVLAAVAHRLGMTPDQVTMISALFTFTGIASIAVLPPSGPMAIGTALALMIGYALDAADGQLARLRGGGSLTGEWLDHVIDSFKIATLHLAVLISMYRFFNLPPMWLLVPITFGAVYVIHFFGMLLTDLLTRNAALRAGVEPGVGGTEGSSTLMALLKLPTDYGVLSLSFLLLSVPAAFQWTYLLLTVANAGYTFLVLGVWHRRLRSLDTILATR